MNNHRPSERGNGAILLAETKSDDIYKRSKTGEMKQSNCIRLVPCPVYWLCYRHANQISVVIEPGASLIHARMRAAIAELDQGEFTEGHEP